MSILLQNCVREPQPQPPLAEACELTREASKKLANLPISDILAILEEWGKRIPEDKRAREVEGAAFLSLFLRQSNLANVLERSLPTPAALDGFAQTKGGALVAAFPRGLVCHWVAGNIPTLGILSLVQSILAKNGNVVRASERSHSALLDLLSPLGEVEKEVEGRIVRGSDVLSAITVVSFPRSDHDSHRTMSLSADTRVIWGGADAVKEIASFPTQEQCETMVFGPKYSIGAIDRAIVESGEFPSLLNRLAMDTAAFDQAGCSSPQVVFFERNEKYSLEQVAQLVGKALSSFSSPPPQRDVFLSNAVNVARAAALLDPDAAMEGSEDRGWTVIADRRVQLEEPVHGRTLFIKEVQDITDIVPLMTPRIQTIGMAFGDSKKETEFATACCRAGAARCVRFGQMNAFGAPWDGTFPLQRLVRFVSLSR